MGCFNVTGAISNSVITFNDDIVLFLGVKCDGIRGGDQFAPGHEFTPIALPIFGRYDDYGGITGIQRDANIEFIESYFGVDIYTLLQVIDDRAVGRDDSGHNEKLYKLCEEIENNFSRICAGGLSYLEFQLATSIEHRLVYNHAISENSGVFRHGIDFDLSYEKTIEAGIEEVDCEYHGSSEKDEAMHFKEVLSRLHGIRDKMYESGGSVMYLAPWTSRNMWCSFVGYFSSKLTYSYVDGFLYLYRGTSSVEEKLFLPEMKDLFLGILKFNEWLSFHSIIFRTHNYHGQEVSFINMYSLYSALSEFYKNKGI